MGNLSPKDVLVRMWRTPNPYALKFTLNVPLKSQGKAGFYSPEECKNVPLAQALFSIEGVKQVYFFQNQLTLTHEGRLKEDEIEQKTAAVIRKFIAKHDPLFESAEPSSPLLRRKKEVNDPMILKIEEILDRTVRPGLQADGGDLEVISFENNEVKISYQGACGGCPSAMTGTLEAIEHILKNELKNSELTVSPL